MLVVHIWVWCAIAGIASLYLISKIGKVESDPDLHRVMATFSSTGSMVGAIMVFAPIMGPLLLACLLLLCFYRGMCFVRDRFQP